MPESLQTRLLRHAFNLVPCFRGSGGRVTYIASDYHEIRVKLPLSLRTRNYVGTIYGGSMYAVVDPQYMIMLMKILGPGFVVWDKAATIRFRRPGRTTLYATFRLSPGDVAGIRRELENEESLERMFEVDLKDAAGVVHASVSKTLYVRRKTPQP